MEFKPTFSDSYDYINATFETDEVNGRFNDVYNIGEISSPYAGEYVVTPNNQTQTLNTADKHLIENVIINPIPSNYGLITWDGAKLRIT